MELHPFGKLTPALVARRRLLAAVRPIERVERVPLAAALGRISAETVRAPRPVPAFARATWDGYAVRSRDVRSARAEQPTTLAVLGEVFAEGGFRGRVRAGGAVAVATGGALPPGSDAVVVFEEVERRDGAIVVRSPVAAGDRIAPAGDDFRQGEVLARRYERLTTAALGALASSGRARVAVYARPKVTILPNGNELASPGAPARVGAVFESNNAPVAAVVAAAGGEPCPLPPVRDDPTAIERALRRALAASDLVLATGGSSVGERDHLPRLFPHLGRLLFHGVAVRPGKPTLAAHAGRKLLVGLPGHPTSCLLDLYWLVLPALRKLARQPGPGWSVRSARLRGPAASLSPGLATVLPLRWEAGEVRSTFRGSSAISSLREAGAFALLPPGPSRVRAGSRLEVCVLDPPLGPGAA